MTEFRLRVLAGFEDGKYHTDGRAEWKRAMGWLHQHGYLAAHGAQPGFYAVTWVGREYLKQPITTR